MSRKKVRRLSHKETEALFDRLLAPTQLAWQERELTIRWLCQQYGADPDNALHRHMLFGVLAWFVPYYMRPDYTPHPGARVKWDAHGVRNLKEKVLKLKGRGFRYKSHKAIAKELKNRFADDFKGYTQGAIEKELAKHYRSREK
jgi:hypothetical protein